MRDGTKSILIVSGFLLFFGVLLPHEYVWNGEGEVSLFPSENSVKNYRVPADIEVTKSGYGWFINKEVYEVKTVYWPNGGYTSFYKCFVEQNKTAFCSDDENEYEVEVNEIPDQPEYDSGDY